MSRKRITRLTLTAAVAATATFGLGAGGASASNVVTWQSAHTGHCLEWAIAAFAPNGGPDQLIARTGIEWGGQVPGVPCATATSQTWQINGWADSWYDPIAVSNTSFRIEQPWNPSTGAPYKSVGGSGGYYCLDNFSGTTVGVNPCTGGHNQFWTETSTTTGWQISNVHSGLYLSDTSGGTVYTAPYSSTENYWH